MSDQERKEFEADYRKRYGLTQDFRSVCEAEWRGWQARAALAQQAVPPEFDVRRIMLSVVPGEDGMGHEVFAKNVDEVVSTLTKLAEQNESLDLQLEAAHAVLKMSTAREPLAQQAAPQASQGAAPAHDLTESQRHTVACMDSWAACQGLPTYSELMVAQATTVGDGPSDDFIEGYKAGAMPLPEQQAEREPLTDEQIAAAWRAWPRTSITSAARAIEFVRVIERAHGIGHHVPGQGGGQ